MALVDRLSNPPSRHRPGKSVMDVWIESLPKDDQAVILAAVNNPDWGHVDLLRALVAEGAPEVADTTFGSWRRKRGLK